MVFRIQEQESAAARANQLASRSSILARELVPGVDLAVCHPPRTALFLLPLLVHQSCKRSHVAVRERIAGAKAQFFHFVKVLQHPPITFLAAFLLVGKDVTSTPREASEEQQQVVFQALERINWNPKRLGVNTPFSTDREARDATIGGD